MKEVVTINLALGLHARPCAKIANIVSDSEINFTMNDRTISAQSIGMILSLGAKKGDMIEIHYEDSTLQNKINQIKEILNSHDN